MHPTIVSVTALLAMGTIWGLQVSMLKLAIQGGHHELNIMLIALFLVSVIYLGITALRGDWFRVTGAHYRFFLVTAVLGYIIPMAATLFAARHIPAGILVLLIALSPICTFAAALGFKTESVSRLRILALVLGCISAAIVLSPNVESGGNESLPWLILALVIPICYGIESVYIDANWPGGLNVVQIGMGEAVAATILSVPLVMVFGELQSLSIAWSIAELAIVVFVLSGVIEVFLYFYLIKTTGGVLVSFANVYFPFRRNRLGHADIQRTNRHGRLDRSSRPRIGALPGNAGHLATGIHKRFKKTALTAPVCPRSPLPGMPAMGKLLRQISTW